MRKILKFTAVIVCLALLLFILYWCIIRTITARSDFKHTIEAMNSGDYSDEFYYADMYGTIKNDLDISSTACLVLQNTEFEVSDYDFHWNKQYAEITVKVRYPDLAKYLVSSFKNADRLYDSLEIETLMNKAILENVVDYMDVKLQLLIVQKGWHWYLAENKDLVNVYSGGLANIYAEILKSSIE